MQGEPQVFHIIGLSLALALLLALWVRLRLLRDDDPDPKAKPGDPKATADAAKSGPQPLESERVQTQRPAPDMATAKADDRPPPPKRPKPAAPPSIRLDFAHYPAVPEHSQSRGDLGERLTAVILAQEGWFAVKSKIGPGGRGIDGVFLKGGGSGESAKLIFTETKTGSSPYRPEQLSREGLIARIGQLYAVDGKDGFWALNAEAVIAMLQAGATALQSELWRHDLYTGATNVWRVDAIGERAHHRQMDSYLMIRALIASDPEAGGSDAAQEAVD